MLLKVIVSPDSFKGSLDASEVASAMEEGIRRVWQEATVEKIPLADGGEGTVKAMVEATGGRIIDKRVTGPLGREVSAFFGVLGDGSTAVIEMAAASGLLLVPIDERDPTVTTTYGTGQLIKAAIDEGCKRIIIGIGGSATNDGGVGMAQALGVVFKDHEGQPLPPGGGALSSLATIDVTRRDPNVDSVDMIVACDVTNPLIGSEGASAVYAPQKGATKAMVDQLEKAMEHYADEVERQLHIDIRHIPGGGAAGGLGAGLIAFLNATLQPGIDVVLDAVRFKERIQDADVIFTGEGMLDRQTAYGKTAVGVAKLAKDADIPVIAIGGGVLPDEMDALYSRGIEAVMSSTWRPVTLQEALAEAYNSVVHSASNAARFISVGMRL